jgi:hypothetical protein
METAGTNPSKVSCAGYTTCNVFTHACLRAALQYGQSHFFKLPGGKLKPDEDGEGPLLLCLPNHCGLELPWAVMLLQRIICT